MRFTKYLGAPLFIVVLLFLFVANFSNVASSYECAGEMSVGKSKVSQAIYFVLEEYRWWVDFWSDSDGNVNLEIPNELIDYYSHVIKVGNKLQIYDPPSEMKGYFSALSKTLALKTPYGLFDGKCVAIK